MWETYAVSFFSFRPCSLVECLVNICRRVERPKEDERGKYLDEELHLWVSFLEIIVHQLVHYDFYRSRADLIRFRDRMFRQLMDHDYYRLSYGKMFLKNDSDFELVNDFY